MLCKSDSEKKEKERERERQRERERERQRKTDTRRERERKTNRKGRSKESNVLFQCIPCHTHTLAINFQINGMATLFQNVFVFKVDVSTSTQTKHFADIYVEAIATTKRQAGQSKPNVGPSCLIHLPHALFRIKKETINVL